MWYACVQILSQFQFAEEKNRLLRAVAGTGPDSLSSLRAKWDKLEIVMESHQLMMKDQVTDVHINKCSHADCVRFFLVLCTYSPFFKIHFIFNFVCNFVCLNYYSVPSLVVSLV